MIKRPAALVGLSIGIGCGLDVTGVASPDFGLPARDAAADASNANVDANIAPPPTCSALRSRDPNAASGVYIVDPDGEGPGSPFSVLCEMTTDGGGWTLVGRERAGETGHFRFLAVDSQNPEPLATGIASGLLGRRFVGKYTQVWIAWSTTSFIRFTLPPSYDLFSNVVDTSIGVASETTSDAALASWFANGGGAQLCVAAGTPDVRPGETSWALKPRDDTYNGCGCNDANWVGRGAYYGGTPNGQQTFCNGFGGGWAGVKGEGEPKGGITPTYETLLWIR